MSVQRLTSLSIVFSLVLSIPVHGDVVEVTEHGFVSEHQLVLAASPSDAYAALVEDVHLWWDASHSYGGAASGFTLEPQAGGCFCERLPDGGSVEHMRVVNVQPGKSLTLQGGLGPLQTMAVNGSMMFSFTSHKQGSTLHYRYVVGGYTPGGLQPLADPVDQVQLGQLKRLQRYLSSGKALNP